jgi:hypothetical protein
VNLRGVEWKIELQYDGKGARAEIIASASDGRTGKFCTGRTVIVEKQIKTGISVPIGSMRYRLALTLAANGLAEVRDCVDRDEPPFG